MPDYVNDYTPYTGLNVTCQQGSYALIACRRGLLRQSHFVVAEKRGFAGEYHAKSVIFATCKEAERERDYLMGQDSGLGWF